MVLSTKERNVNTAKLIQQSRSESSNTMIDELSGKYDFWAVKPSEIANGIVAYFGRCSSMKRGQNVKVMAEARCRFFMVAPVDKKRRICGPVRAVKRANLALVQRDFFVTA